MEILGLGSKVDVDFLFERQEQRKQIDVKIDENKKTTQYVFYDGEDVNGIVGKYRDRVFVILCLHLGANQIEEE